MASSPNRDPPVRGNDKVPIGRETNSGRRSDIRSYGTYATLCLFSRHDRAYTQLAFRISGLSLDIGLAGTAQCVPSIVEKGPEHP
jgi:hypothetical protein